MEGLSPQPQVVRSVLKGCDLLLCVQMEELKAQLESCHQQLLDSNKHKQDLELQLRMALEREQDIRTGYISPVSVCVCVCVSSELCVSLCLREVLC